MAICWHCGCEFPLNDKDGTKCPECGHDAGNTPAALGTGLIISFCLIVFQSNDGILFLGIWGAIGFTIGGLCMAIKTIKRNKQWKKRQNAKTPKTLSATKKNNVKRAKKHEILPDTIIQEDTFADIGKHNGENVRFDIKPDREIEIEYQDASGEITHRKITAQVIETAWGGLVIKAYCHLRQSQRSFKLENIRQIYENGHKISLNDWLTEIGFTRNRRVKKRIVKKKLSEMVDKMSTSALDEFIKNSTTTGV